ncbi:MAG TPA: ATP-binding protein [Gaiellaceae bacterium]|nr:ATP-binding protein [Gaiellaceae bacterium]
MSNRELEQKAELAELLLHAARQLGESLEPERVYERFHELLTDVVQHDGLVVSSYDDRDDLIRAEYVWTEGEILDPSTLPPVPLNRSGGGMQSRVIVSGEPLVFNDVAERVTKPDGVYYNVDREGTIQKLPESGPSGTAAAMMVPVKDEGRVVGVVQLMSDLGRYSSKQLEVFDGLVTQMAAAVRNARLQQERRRLEAAEAAARAVAAEREQAARVLDAVGDVIFLVDREGVVRLWNKAAELLSCLPAERVLGQSLDALIPEWEALAARISIAEDGTLAPSATLPLQIGEKDLWLSFAAVRTADGVIYACHDVTSERRLEEEKTDLVATISHELRTPMSAVYGAAKTLLRTDVEFPPERRQQLLEMIATQATRLSQITEELLLTSRLDRGDLPVEAEPVDIAEIVGETVEAMGSQLPEAPEIEIEIPADVGAVSGDRDRIQQVLVNLLDNAVKYGAGPVKVQAYRTDGVIRICVVDAGPGIALADQPKIFEKFYRADPQLARSPGGTGLGLYISRELAQRMGGRLELNSELGAGATFIVELPQA